MSCCLLLVDLTFSRWQEDLRPARKSEQHPRASSLLCERCTEILELNSGVSYPAPTAAEVTTCSLALDPLPQCSHDLQRLS